jgi:hypothetical protein
LIPYLFTVFFKFILFIFLTSFIFSFFDIERSSVLYLFSLVLPLFQDPKDDASLFLRKASAESTHIGGRLNEVGVCNKLCIFTAALSKRSISLNVGVQEDGNALQLLRATPQETNNENSARTTLFVYRPIANYFNNF